MKKNKVKEYLIWVGAIYVFLFCIAIITVTGYFFGYYAGANQSPPNSIVLMVIMYLTICVVVGKKGIEYIAEVVKDD